MLEIQIFQKEAVMWFSEKVKVLDLTRKEKSYTPRMLRGIVRIFYPRICEKEICANFAIIGQTAKDTATTCEDEKAI